MEHNREPPWYQRRRSDWEDDEDDEDSSDVGGGSSDKFELTELIESTVHLDRWLDSAAAQVTPISLSVSDREVCTTTPSAELSPYASEYEGYMGN
jgi:hypothetical protein